MKDQKGFTLLEILVKKALRIKNKKLFLRGFTLIELLVVMTIIGILGGTVVVSSMRGLAQSRDARRIQELYQIANALLQYKIVNRYFPEEISNSELGCDSVGNGSWDVGNEALSGDDFLKPLVDEGFLHPLPKEWTGVTERVGGTQCTYRYQRAVDPCGCSGTYAILYAACETKHCPTGEKPDCCTWAEGSGDYDPYDIIIFLKE